jgi:hypothetical protein
MDSLSVNKVIDDYQRLSIEDMEYVASIIQKQLIELKRDNLAARVQEAKSNYEQGLTKSGSLKELLKDLESD